jgi:hypothetical protein
MRKPRILAQGAWYEVRTAINNREGLFREQKRAKAVLFRVLREADKIFTFEMRGLSLGAIWLSFYIKPEDGFQLPAIMQWLKQTFAARFNRRDGRTGHQTEAEAEGGWGQAPSGGGGGGTSVFARNPPPRRVSPRVIRGKASS